MTKIQEKQKEIEQKIDELREKRQEIKAEHWIDKELKK
jgi:hypothetical protein